MKIIPLNIRAICFIIGDNMLYKDINKFNWNIDNNIKIRHFDIGGYSLIEQECSINVLRAGLIDESKQEIQVSCNNQTMITELSKSEYFILQEIELSNHPRNKDFILSIKGILEIKGLTIRKKKPQYTEEEKQIRSDRAKINLRRVIK
jgi:hypothetical protein